MGDGLIFMLSAGVLLFAIGVGGAVFELIFKIPPIRKKVERFLDSLPLGGK